MRLLAAVAALLLSGTAMAQVYSDSVVGTMKVRGQKTPVEHLTLNEGTARDICTKYDLPTDQNVCWDNTLAAFKFTSPIRVDNSLDYTNDQLLMLLSLGYTDNDPRIRWDGTAGALTITGWGLNLESDDGADGSPVRAFKALDAGVTFGPPSGTYTFTFGHTGSGDTALFNAPMVFDGVSSAAYADFWVPTAGGTALTVFDGSSGGGTQKMLDITSDGTNTFERYYTPGAGTVDCTTGRTAADTWTLGGCNMSVSAGTFTSSGDIHTTAGNVVVDSPGVVSGDRWQDHCTTDVTQGVILTTPTYCADSGNIFVAGEGIPVIRAGSLMGVAASCTVTFYTIGTGTIRTEVEKNGTVVFQCDQNYTSNGVKTVVCTQARGVDTFAAGDLWVARFTQITAAPGSVNHCTATVELITN